MSLTDTAVRNAKVRAKAYKLYDEKGLFLLVKPSGSLGWRFKYSYGGVEKLLSLGMYPDVRLKDACARSDEARGMVAAGADPSIKRQVEKTARANTFAAVAEEWLEIKRATLSESTWRRDREQLVKNGRPVLGEPSDCRY